MAAENQSGGGIVLDTSLILRTIRYYAIIGAGLGFLGVVLMLVFSGSDDLTFAILSGLLSIFILMFAVLCGPLIAAFVGHATARDGIGGRRARAVNSGIANGIGFAIFGIVVAILLWLGIDVLLASGGTGGGGGTSATATATPTVTSGSDGGNGGGSSSLLPIADLVTLIMLMSISNALVGGAITFFLEDRDGPPRGAPHESPDNR